MQRPRRTTEFHEEPLANKRQSRQQITAATPGTAQKYATRPSRIAVRTRSSSAERSSAPNAAAHMRINALSLGVTPQKTPAGKSPCARVLQMTADKKTGGGAQHNDKRWIQEQVARITEYLRGEAAIGKIPGIGMEFFNARSAGLKQMSIKQFVAIVNYLLQFVCGSRCTVGTNHVEDIVKIMQKLQYPHQLNKSWLKTPNTQHSFGNVLLLLDFLMDFVPFTETDKAEQCEEPHAMQFPFLAPEEYTFNQMGDEYMRIPDIDFQAQMLRDTEKSFQLWDKQLDAEYEALQLQTCNALVRKQCGLDGIEGVQRDMTALQQQLETVEAQRPPLRKQDEEQLQKLEEELKNTHCEIDRLSDDCETDCRQLQQLLAQLPQLKQELAVSQRELTEMKRHVATQLYTTEQRDAQIEAVAELRHLRQSQERTLRELEDCHHHQQVQQALTNKQLKEQLHKCNAQLREIAYTRLAASATAVAAAAPEELQLPLHANAQDVKRLVPLLQELHANSARKLAANEAAIAAAEQQIVQLTHAIDATLSSKLSAAQVASATAKRTQLQHEQQMAQERRNMLEQTATLTERTLELQTQLTDCAGEFAQRQQQLEQLADNNEQTMAQAERDHSKSVTERCAYLNKYDEILDQANADLQELATIVDENEVLINRLKQVQKDGEQMNDMLEKGRL